MSKIRLPFSCKTQFQAPLTENLQKSEVLNKTWAQLERLFSDLPLDRDKP